MYVQPTFYLRRFRVPYPSQPREYRSPTVQTHSGYCPLDGISRRRPWCEPPIFLTAQLGHQLPHILSFGIQARILELFDGRGNP
jgi:hypothetical protein